MSRAAIVSTELRAGEREVYFIEIPAVKDTPKGCWLDYYGTRKCPLKVLEDAV